MKRWTPPLLAALLLSACAARPGPAVPPPAPSQVYQQPAPVNTGWEQVRPFPPHPHPPPPPPHPDRTAEELYSAGLSFLRAQQGPEAVAHLQEAFRKEPATPRFGYQLGAALEYVGDLAKAKSVYQEALSHSPEEPDLKRAAAALASDFTMDGKPDRIEARGPFFDFFDGATGQRLLEFQPWQGEESKRAELVDLGGPVPAIVLSSPGGIVLEVFRGDGFTGFLSGQSAVYDPTRRQLIVQRPVYGSPEPPPPVGFVRLTKDPEGRPTMDLRAAPHVP